MDDLKKKRFLWGAALAWAAWVPTLIGLGNAFSGISREKATGLAAVAGGLVEMFVVWGNWHDDRLPSGRNRLPGAGLCARALDAQPDFRGVHPFERIDAGFGWAFSVDVLVSEASGVLSRFLASLLYCYGLICPSGAWGGDDAGENRGSSLCSE